MCHTINLFAQTALLKIVHCNESLVRVEVSGFCYTISTGSPLGLFLDIMCHGNTEDFGSSGRVPLHACEGLWDFPGGRTIFLSSGLLFVKGFYISPLYRKLYRLRKVGLFGLTLVYR